MARPRTALGTWGKITAVGQVQNGDGHWVAAPEDVKPQRWRARTKVRDLDGELRDVERYDTTKTKAENALKAALRDRTTPRKGDHLRAETLFGVAGEYWLTQVDRKAGDELSENTVTQYKDTYGRHVEDSPLADYTLREANRVPVLRSWLQEIADDHGTGSAKTAKSVVSSILQLAVDDGVLDLNAARQMRPVKASSKRESERDHKRAFTREERRALLEFAVQDKRANDQDIVDLLHWMAGTGARISEALDQKLTEIDLGRAIVRGTKSVAAERQLVLPPWLVDRMEARVKLHGVTTSGLAFPSTRTGRRRDRRNTTRQMRSLLDRAGFEWAVPHTFRRTVATWIDQAGLGSALAADQLGHADPSFTARTYFGRKTDTSKAAEIL